MADYFDKQQAAVHAALCDNFNTPRAIKELFDLVNAVNSYVSQEPKDIKIALVRQMTEYVFKILKTFGVYES